MHFPHPHDPRTERCDSCAWWPDLAEGLLQIMANFDALNAAVAAAGARLDALSAQVADLSSQLAAVNGDQASVDAAAAALNAAVAKDSPAPAPAPAPVEAPAAPATDVPAVNPPATTI